MHGHMNVKLKINFFCPQLKTARLASLVNNKICFIFVDIKLNENSVFNNYHTTNKCTNCISFIFKSLFLKHFHFSYMFR